MLLKAIFLFAITVLFASSACFAKSWTPPWSGPINTNAAPISDYARHSSVAIPKRNHAEHDFIFEVFGMKENLTAGELHGAGASITAVYTATRKFDVKTNTWSSITSANGQEPSARGASSIAYVTVGGGRKVFIFGGAGLHFLPSNDPFWAYDLDAGSWNNLNSIAGAPSPKLGVGATPYLNGFLLFGGVGFNSDFTGFEGSNQLWYFNALTSTWSQLSTTGDVPFARWFCRIFIRSEEPNTLILFGGEAGNPNTGDVHFVGDQFKLNLLTLTWTRVTPVLPLPRVRAHCAMGLFESVNDDDDQLICHSGDYGNCVSNVLLVPSTAVYNIAPNEWFDGVIPLYAAGPRSKAAQLTCFNEDLCYHTGGFGGMNCDLSEQVYLNDVYSYDPINKAFRLAQSLVV